jgi:hypothetical protein
MLGLTWLHLPASHHAPPYAEQRANPHQEYTKQQKGEPKALSPLPQDAAQHKEGGAREPSERKENAEEALARYTFWLMLFTGVLAASTIALWCATMEAARHVRAAERAHVYGGFGCRRDGRIRR